MPITDPGHLHSGGFNPQSQTGAGGGGFNSSAVNTGSATTGITAGSSSPAAFTNLPPTTIGGQTVIRAG